MEWLLYACNPYDSTIFCLYHDGSFLKYFDIDLFYSKLCTPPPPHVHNFRIKIIEINIISEESCVNRGKYFQFTTNLSFKWLVPLVMNAYIISNTGTIFKEISFPFSFSLI